MSLPFRYELIMCVEIAADSDLDETEHSVKPTIERLAKLLEADSQVIKADRWPDIEYRGKNTTEGEIT